MNKKEFEDYKCLYIHNIHNETMKKIFIWETFALILMAGGLTIEKISFLFTIGAGVFVGLVIFKLIQHLIFILKHKIILKQKYSKIEV